MKKAIVTVGVSASGKTTFAESFLQEGDNRTSWVNINRDDIRWELLGVKDWGKWNWKREKEVTSIQRDDLAKAASEGKNVIISDTNLHPKFRNDLLEYLHSLGYTTVTQKVFTVSFEEACKRDTARPNGVGYSVIAKQMEQMNKYVEAFNPPEAAKYEHKEGLPTCIIVDIDGTLAHMTNRGPFEWDKVGDDEVDIAVRNLCNTYESCEQDIRVILMSGRDGVCRDDTVDWLRKNSVSYTSLFMREREDTRKDTIVKKELFDTHIKGKYNVEFVVDDRPSVCRQWHDMGLKVLRVGNPYIEF